MVGDVREYCCNTNFPGYDLDRKNDPALIECDAPYDNIEVSCFECARMWAKYNKSWDSELLQQACGEEVPDSITAVSGFCKISNQLHPAMKWNFVWGHFYVIERKVNDGSWSPIYTYQLPGNTIESPDTDFVDNSINLLKFQGIVKYRVYNKIFDEVSAPSYELVWNYLPEINTPIND